MVYHVVWHDYWEPIWQMLVGKSMGRSMGMWHVVVVAIPYMSVTNRYIEVHKLVSCQIFFQSVCYKYVE